MNTQKLTKESTGFFEEAADIVKKEIELLTKKFKHMKTEINAVALLPQDSHKSFYCKAIVIKDGDLLKLRSYDTIVAIYNKATDALQING
jgi:hypothetical protein